ncbi:hypothetical protein OF83DRAFT_1085284 [Amylostereum chailletii]|nr:hypothetical protein OF83DRAFT_1085284 [Amylostereum chailletii]
MSTFDPAVLTGDNQADKLASMTRDNSRFRALLDMVRADMKDVDERGETMAQHILRENALSIKLKAKEKDALRYEQAENDTKSALKRDGGILLKALYRRGQARRLLGKLDAAETDIRSALTKVPSDASLLKELDDIIDLKVGSKEAQSGWLDINRGREILEI